MKMELSPPEPEGTGVPNYICLDKANEGADRYLLHYTEAVIGCAVELLYYHTTRTVYGDVHMFMFLDS